MVACRLVAPTPPVARVLPTFVEIHGERLRDDHAWLRQKDDPAVRAYLEAENAYTADVLRPTEAFRGVLYREMLGRIKEDDRTVPYRKGGHFYYTRTETGQQYPIACRKAGRLEAPEEVILDLNELARGQPFLALGVALASDDGGRLAYSTDVQGFREYTLAVKDLATGRLWPERIPHVTSVAWSADPDVLFYVVEDAAKRPWRLYRHRLETPVTEDALLYEEADPLFRLSVRRTRSLAWVLVTSASFTASEVRCLPAVDPAAPLRLLAPREPDHEYYVDHGGERFFVRTNGGGRRNFRLVTAPADDPGPARWTELLPHRDDVMLERADVLARHLVVHERHDGLLRLRVVDLDRGGAHHVEFPEPVYDVAAEGNAEFDTTVYRFSYESPLTPPSVFDYDMDTRARTLRKQTEVLGGYDPSRYRTARVHATAPDGTRIPISLVQRADAAPDGPRPMLLTGYGAYGYPYPTGFSSSRVSLLDRGVSFAIAHVRGGGDLGKAWHDAGRMAAKPNSFADFISAASFLVARGDTARDRLVIEGGSAGGLLVGAVLNRQPDLCRAAVLVVPFVDVINTMLDESLPLTIGEFEEWGNPRVREHYDVMRSYCPYTNIRPQRYPAMLVRASLHDSQVMYWEPAKYVARLRATKVGDEVLLLETNLDAGHGGASGRYDALRELALDYAFILWQLGLAP